MFTSQSPARSRAIKSTATPASALQSVLRDHGRAVMPMLPRALHFYGERT